MHILEVANGLLLYSRLWSPTMLICFISRIYELEADLIRAYLSSCTRFTHDKTDVSGTQEEYELMEYNWIIGPIYTAFRKTRTCFSCREIIFEKNLQIARRKQGNRI